jgi:hypothetical protein
MGFFNGLWMFIFSLVGDFGMDALLKVLMRDARLIFLLRMLLHLQRTLIHFNMKSVPVQLEQSQMPQPAQPLLLHS